MKLEIQVSKNTVISIWFERDGLCGEGLPTGNGTLGFKVVYLNGVEIIDTSEHRYIDLEYPLEPDKIIRTFYSLEKKKPG